jgi:hypothetical protein
MKKLDDSILTLHRYFIWADRMRVHFDQILKLGKEKHANYQFDTLLYMSYWYAGMYVVIEGWNELGLTDPRIDKLINSKNVDLLRIYRNGVFHFRKKYYDENRLLPFIVDGENPVEWVRLLREALSDYFLKWLGSVKNKNLP